MLFALNRLRLPIAIIVAAAFAAALAFVAFSSTAEANHSWANYHWGRTTGNPFTLVLGDNVDTKWDSYLRTSAGAVTDSYNDWNSPTNTAGYTDVLNPRVQDPGGTTGAKCEPTSGRVEVCNSTYGSTGWLGVATIWISGPHIVKGTAKNNDTYFNTAPYNTSAYKNLVMCQEVAHTFGLDHQDETFNNANLGTCMDYTNDPDGGADGASPNDPGNEYPNQHDYAQLTKKYDHLDRTSTLTSSAASNLPAAANEVNSSDRRQWGTPIHTSSDGRIQKYERNLGNGMRAITLVIWAEPEDGGSGHEHTERGTEDEHTHSGTEDEQTDGGTEHRRK